MSIRTTARRKSLSQNSPRRYVGDRINVKKLLFFLLDYRSYAWQLDVLFCSLTEVHYRRSKYTTSQLIHLNMANGFVFFSLFL